MSQRTTTGVLHTHNAHAYAQALVTSGLLSKTGILDLDAPDDALVAALSTIGDAALAAERDEKLDSIVACMKLSRYSNLHSLLQEHLTEVEYLQIVRNKILPVAFR